MSDPVQEAAAALHTFMQAATGADVAQRTLSLSRRMGADARTPIAEAEALFLQALDVFDEAGANLSAKVRGACEYQRAQVRRQQFMAHIADPPPKPAADG